MSNDTTPAIPTTPWAETYGPLVYEIGHTLLWSHSGAKQLTTHILRALTREKKNLESRWARSRVIQLSIRKATELYSRDGRELSAPEKMMLDALTTSEERLKHVDSFFHRLSFNRQVILLLKDKLNIPDEEIAAALSVPVASLMHERRQALEALSDWIYGSSSEKKLETLSSRVKDLKKVKPPEGWNWSAQTISVFATARWILRDRRRIWERTPLVLKTSLEGLGIGITALVLVAAVPRLRDLYERSIQKRLEALSLGDLALEEDEIPAGTPLTRGKTSRDASATHDDFNGEEEDSAADTIVEAEEGDSDLDPLPKAEAEQLKVGSSEIWRFNVKTDSPRELRKKVFQLLTDLQLSADTPGISGIEAPGGIQFDILVPTRMVGSIKIQLQRLTTSGQKVLLHQPSHAVDNTSISDVFTWYKSRSRKAVPAGKARVVIWLSQT